MSSISHSQEDVYFHRQGSVLTLPDEDDQKTTASDSPMDQQQQKSSDWQHQSNEYSSPDRDNYPTTSNNLDETHPIASDYQYSDSYQTGVSLQTVPDIDTDGSGIQNWDQLLGQTSDTNGNLSHSDSANDLTQSFGFQQQQQQTTENNNFQQFQQQNAPEEISAEFDYEHIVRSRHLYFDPNPQIIQKPLTVAPLVYKQNISVRFLQPPPLPQAPPLIVREVRQPQPPPPPPVVIRQHPPPPLSPPPLILRERPPLIPAEMTAKILTRTLPPVPPPPRSVIFEKLPPLPPKPRDIIIERWIPYESLQKRQVIVHRAEEVKPHPQPKNVIITYEPIQARVVRQFQRLGIKPEDPHGYSARYGSSLLNAEQLLAQARQLGISEDLSPPISVSSIESSSAFEESSMNIDAQNYNFDAILQQPQQKFESYSTGLFENQSTSNFDYVDESGPQSRSPYAPTYENLIGGNSFSYDDSSEQQHGPNFYTNDGEDLPTDLTQFPYNNQQQSALY